MSSTRLRRTAVVVALAALALTGCSASQAGAASVVGDQTVTDTQVADMTGELQTQLTGVAGASFDEKTVTGTVVTLETRHLILAAVAAKEGITVTQGQVDAYIANQVATQYGGKRQGLVDALAQAGIPESQLETVFHDNLIILGLVGKLAPGVTDATAQQKAFTDYMTPFVAELGVQVAPRYGTWATWVLGPVPDDLSVVPAAPTPAS